MNYQELVNLSIAYADRYDDEVAGQMDNFIYMVESRINRLLKTRKQSNRAYTPCVTDQEYYSLPPDWAGMRDIQLNSDVPTTTHSTQSFHLTDPKDFEAKRDGPPGNKVYYTIIADQLQIYPTQEAGNTLEITYFQRVPHLNAQDFNNWLSEDYPDIYVAGMTAEISLFAKDYETATGWFERLTKSVDELDTVDWVERWSGDALQVRLG